MNVLNSEIKTNPILVSVIIPVYNREYFLGECLDSILNQTMKNIEVIIVDDGSYDLSYDIALSYAKHDERIRAYQIPNSGGPSKPRNIGMELAKGEYITFVDSDDKLAFNALELLYKKARRLNAEITFSVPLMFNHDGILYPIYADALKNDDVALPLKYRRETLFLQSTCGILFTNELIKQSNLQFHQNYNSAEDQLFIIDALLFAENIACLKDYVYLYRKGHDKDALTANISEKSAQSILAVLKEIQNIFFSKTKFIFKDYREILLEIKLLRLHYLEYEIGNKTFFQSIIKPEELFLPGDGEILLNLLRDDYTLFTICGYDVFQKDNYYRIFFKISHRTSEISENTFDLAKIPSISRHSFSTNKEVIPIVFAANNYYIPYFECALLSLLQKASPDYNYHIVVLERDWDNSQKQFFLNHYSADNVAFSFYNMYYLLSDINTIEIGHFTVDTYARLRIPSLLKSYDKCIYLDCDMIINDDISKLYQIDLDDKHLGASLDYGANKLKDYINSLGIDPARYFNAGVLLWDLKKTRNDHLDEYLVKISKAREKYEVVDQDIMNIAFYSKVKLIDYRWNYHPNGNQLVGKSNIKLLEVWDQIGEDFSIIHFLTAEKPWLNRERDKSDYFWTIAKQTMHYEIILKRYVHQIAKNINQHIG